jgi:hypothetical protein
MPHLNMPQFSAAISIVTLQFGQLKSTAGGIYSIQYFLFAETPKSSPFRLKRSLNVNKI